MILLNHKLEDLDNLKYNYLIELSCDFCKNKMERKVVTIKCALNRNRKNFFCSKDCHKQFYTKNTRLSHCLNCNSEMKGKNKFLFCSKKCYHTHRINNLIKIKKDVNINVNNHQISKIKIINKKHFIYCIYNCEKCSKECLKRPSDIKKSKNGLFFCSKSCRMTYQNLNNPKKYGCRKSKAEIFLSKLIKDKFPNLEIQENNRLILDSKLEIDIFIPSKNLAIELNGPVHYFPIYGEEKLKRCQNNDLSKQLEIQKKQINLIIIDISHLKSKKKSEKFLTEYFISYIDPILVEK